jgi:hypothetical protein
MGLIEKLGHGNLTLSFTQALERAREETGYEHG